MSRKLHARFTAVLPRIVRHARVMFRFIKCYHTKEDKIQEVRGYCWKWIRLLHKAKKKWWTFVSRLADFACKAVKSGRKIAGMTIKDVMSEVNQARKGYCICKLPDYSTESTNPLVEALTDNTQSRSMSRSPSESTSQRGCPRRATATVPCSRIWPSVTERRTWPTAIR